MEVADVKYMEQQLKAQFDVQKEVYEKRIEEYKQIILAYDKDLRKANTKLDKIKEIAKWREMVDCDCVICNDAVEILEIIGE